MGRIVVAGLTIGICAYLSSLAGDYPRAARRLPQILALCVMGLAAAGIVQAVVQILGERRHAGDPPPLFTAPPREDVVVGLGFVALVAAYIWAIPHAGYLVATPLMLLVPLAVLRPIGWLGIGITLLAVTGGILLIFIWFLNLPIPLIPGD